MKLRKITRSIIEKNNIYLDLIRGGLFHYKHASGGDFDAFALGWYQTLVRGRHHWAERVQHRCRCADMLRFRLMKWCIGIGYSVPNHNPSLVSNSTLATDAQRKACLEQAAHLTFPFYLSSACVDSLGSHRN